MRGSDVNQSGLLRPQLAPTRPTIDARRRNDRIERIKRSCENDKPMIGRIMVALTTGHSSAR
jgi:hypothetical protein